MSVVADEKTETPRECPCHTPAAAGQDQGHPPVLSHPAHAGQGPAKPPAKPLHSPTTWPDSGAVGKVTMQARC